MSQIRCRLLVSAARLDHLVYLCLAKSYEESAKGAIRGMGAVSIPTKTVYLAECQPIPAMIGVILTPRAAAVLVQTTQ